MFFNSDSAQLDLSQRNTSNVTKMSFMFNQSQLKFKKSFWRNKIVKKC